MESAAVRYCSWWVTRILGFFLSTPWTHLQRSVGTGTGPPQCNTSSPVTTTHLLSHWIVAWRPWYVTECTVANAKLKIPCYPSDHRQTSPMTLNSKIYIYKHKTQNPLLSPQITSRKRRSGLTCQRCVDQQLHPQHSVDRPGDKCQHLCTVLWPGWPSPSDPHSSWPHGHQSECCPREAWSLDPERRGTITLPLT